MVCAKRLAEARSENLLFGKLEEQELTAVKFNNRFRKKIDEAERGYIRINPNLRNFRPYEKKW